MSSLLRVPTVFHDNQRRWWKNSCPFLWTWIHLRNCVCVWEREREGKREIILINTEGKCGEKGSEGRLEFHISSLKTIMGRIRDLQREKDTNLRGGRMWERGRPGLLRGEEAGPGRCPGGSVGKHSQRPLASGAGGARGPGGGWCRDPSRGAAGVRDPRPCPRRPWATWEKDRPWKRLEWNPHRSRVPRAAGGSDWVKTFRTWSLRKRHVEFSQSLEILGDRGPVLAPLDSCSGGKWPMRLTL